MPFNKYFNAEGDRVDAVEKVTGKAKFTAEHHLPDLAYGQFVCSTITKGIIRKMDVSKALAAPGVLDVIYYKNCPHIPGYNRSRKKGKFKWRGLQVLNNKKVRFYGQPIALVVADSFENATAAINLVKAEYKVLKFETDFHKARQEDKNLKPAGNYLRGIADAYKTAPVFIEAEYNIPIEVHHPMEMHSTIAVWDVDDKLTVYDKNQGPKGVQSNLAKTFGIPEKNVRVITEFVGGAFGNGLRSWMHVPSACIAAKKLKRPVKVLLTRPQMFNLVGYRPQSWQKLGLGADNTGKLMGITHNAISNSSRYEDFKEGIVDVSKFLYASENVNTDYKILPLDLSTPTWMRGPGEVSGCYALESALDELAHKLNIDPVELRTINFTDTNPENKLPWSAKNLKDCYATGKEKIGWENRSSVPGTLKEEGMLVGYGMGGGVFGAWKGGATVKAILKKDGKLILQSAVSDMGPGTTTAMTKIAADNLQMPSEKIKFMLGDSDLPPGPSQGGSGTTSTLGSAVNLICDELKKTIKDLAIEKIDAFKNLKAEDLDVQNENVFSVKDATIKISIPELLQTADKSTIEIQKESKGGDRKEAKYATNSFSVHFVKLLVHPETGEIKMKHVVTCGDAGKIISEKTARSQMLGGAVGGIGMALKEELIIDHKTGKIENDNLAAYHLPLHTDIPQIDVWFTNKADFEVNAIGAKGLGEIALIGFAAAVSNAVFNATGKRVRNLPITPEKILAAKMEV